MFLTRYGYLQYISNTNRTCFTEMYRPFCVVLWKKWLLEGNAEYLFSVVLEWLFWSTSNSGKTHCFCSCCFSVSYLIPNGNNNMCSTNGEDVPKLGCLELLFPIVILPIHSLNRKLYCPTKPYYIQLQWVKFKTPANA